MERLTRRIKGKAHFISRDDSAVSFAGVDGAFTEKKNYTNHQLHEKMLALDITLERLATYEDAEQQKRLVIGKFPIDAEVWITEDCIGEVERVRILAFTNEKSFVSFRTSSDGGWTEDTAWIDNDSLYSTREEAEIALAAQEEGK